MNQQDTDVLISRILDRRAAPPDFDAFAASAGAEPSAWTDLLAALRDDAALGVAADSRLDLAEHIEAPVIDLHRARLVPACSAAARARAWTAHGPSGPTNWATPLPSPWTWRC